MAPAEAGALAVELVWSPQAGETRRLPLQLPPGSTVRQALQAARALAADLPGDPSALGVWGKACGLDQALRAGDRLELYRPLRVDPKEARRQRYRAQGPRRRG